mmetsp:Transcript_15859/g.34957  ORF Transcript_15859/g.34957 Transcript_15859/m.34957 type:complete len:433 (+) Transcript_15859:1-1299(+)
MAGQVAELKSCGRTHTPVVEEACRREWRDPSLTASVREDLGRPVTPRDPPRIEKDLRRASPKLDCRGLGASGVRLEVPAVSRTSSANSNPRSKTDTGSSARQSWCRSSTSLEVSEESRGMNQPFEDSVFGPLTRSPSPESSEHDNDGMPPLPLPIESPAKRRRQRAREANDQAAAANALTTSGKRTQSCPRPTTDVHASTSLQQADAEVTSGPTRSSLPKSTSIGWYPGGYGGVQSPPIPTAIRQMPANYTTPPNQQSPQTQPSTWDQHGHAAVHAPPPTRDSGIGRRELPRQASLGPQGPARGAGAREQEQRLLGTRKQYKKPAPHGYAGQPVQREVSGHAAQFSARDATVIHTVDPSQIRPGNGTWVARQYGKPDQAAYAGQAGAAERSGAGGGQREANRPVYYGGQYQAVTRALSPPGPKQPSLRQCSA